MRFAKKTLSFIILSVFSLNLFSVLPVFAEAVVIPLPGNTGSVVAGQLEQTEEQRQNSQAAVTASQQANKAAAEEAQRYDKACGDDPKGLFNFRYNLCTVWVNILWGLQAIWGGFLYLFARSFDLLVGGVMVRTGELLGVSADSDSIFYTSWKVVRDVFNIVGFFAAVYAGVLRIFGADKEEFKKVLIRVILFALLTNFSYPITRSLIDFSNIISLNIYGGIVDYNLATKFTGDDGGISSKFMQAFGLSTFITDENNINRNSSSPLANVSTTTGTIILIIFFIFLASIMAKACIFVLARIATLMMCVILSPLMFIGGVAPFMSGLHDRWRKNFIDALATGPILMISLWLGLKVINGASEALAELGKGSESDNFETFIVVIFGGIVFYICMKMTEKFSGEVGQFGANILGKVTNSVTGVAGGLALGAATGGVGFAARRGLGMAGNALTNNSLVKNTDENHGAFRRMTASLARNTGDRLNKTKVFGASNDDLVKNKTAKVMSGARKEQIIKDKDLRAEYEKARDNKDKAGLDAVARKADFLRRDSTQEKIKSGELSREGIIAGANDRRLFRFGDSTKRLTDQAKLNDSLAREMGVGDVGRAETERKAAEEAARNRPLDFNVQNPPTQPSTASQAPSGSSTPLQSQAPVSTPSSPQPDLSAANLSTSQTLNPAPTQNPQTNTTVSFGETPKPRAATLRELKNKSNGGTTPPTPSV